MNNMEGGAAQSGACSISSSGNFIIKAQFDDDIRRVAIHNEDLTKTELEIMMQRIFSGKIDVKDPILIRYKDEDGDLVTITDDSDLKLAIQTSNNILKLNLTIVDYDEPAQKMSNPLLDSKARKELKAFIEKMSALLSADSASNTNEYELSTTHEATPSEGAETSATTARSNKEFDPLNGHNESSNQSSLVPHGQSHQGDQQQLMHTPQQQPQSMPPQQSLQQQQPPPPPQFYRMQQPSYQLPASQPPPPQQHDQHHHPPPQHQQQQQQQPPPPPPQQQQQQQQQQQPPPPPPQFSYRGMQQPSYTNNLQSTGPAPPPAPYPPPSPYPNQHQPQQQNPPPASNMVRPPGYAPYASGNPYFQQPQSLPSSIGSNQTQNTSTPPDLLKPNPYSARNLTKGPRY